MYTLGCAKNCSEQQNYEEGFLKARMFLHSWVNSHSCQLVLVASRLQLSPAIDNGIESLVVKVCISYRWTQ